MTLRTKLINTGNHKTDRLRIKVTSGNSGSETEAIHSLGRGESVDLNFSAGEGMELFCTDVIHGAGNVRSMTAGLLLTEGPGGKMMGTDFGDCMSRPDRIRSLAAALVNEIHVMKVHALSSGMEENPDAVAERLGRAIGNVVESAGIAEDCHP